MKKIISISFCIVAISLYSCKKDKKTPEEETPVEATPTTYPNYSNLKVGNYWIYERFKIDPSGNATSINVIDSCYIEKDTTIHGNVFYKYVYPNVYIIGGPDTQIISSSYYRDSLSYMVSVFDYNNIIFSSEDFTTEFKTSYYINPQNDTMYKYTWKMGDKNLNISIPLGNFITSSYQEIIHFYPSYPASCGTVKIRDTRYAENVGKITERFNIFLGSTCDTWERRLIRYHLN
jgi:hypothetical protein